MKNSIHTLALTTLIAAIATTTAHASSRIVNHGRAGFVAVPLVEQQHSSARSATVVALAMDKPEQSPTRIKNAGRAGYVAVPNTMQR